VGNLIFMFCSPTYNITVTQIQVGTVGSDVEFTALFDSGTSFTYLVDPAYTKLSRSVSIFSFDDSFSLHNLSCYVQVCLIICCFSLALAV